MSTILSIQKNSGRLAQFYVAKYAARKMFILLIAFFTAVQVYSQSGQHVTLGDKYFAAGEYYTAAGLYEQYLNPSKKEKSQANFPINSRRYRQGGAEVNVNRLDILYKQAESYRLANYWKEAAAKYKECYDKESGKYIDAIYWYAVCQRSLGNYMLAEESLNTFIVNSGAGNALNEQAKKEQQTIQFIRRQLARPDTVMYMVKKTHTTFGTEKGIFAMNRLAGNKFLYTSTVTDSAGIGVNPYHSRLFVATLENGTLTNTEEIIIDGADLSSNQGAACLSADKSLLYFTQWKKENGKNISSIYFAIKQGSGWSKPTLLASVNQDGFSSRQPFCSADGKTLYFASDMPGGSGGFDIWYAPLQWDGTTGKPVNVGAVINTAGDEQAPFYHAGSNQLVFASNGMQGMGGFDLFTSKMKESAWSAPENMGHPVNSSRDDIYFTASEEKELLKNAIISSDRGSECCLETYSVVKSPKKKKIAGIVRDCKTNEPAANAEVVMKDASGNTVKMTTGPDGKFSFELAGEANQNSFIINKENYKEKTETASIESVNESDWQTDILYNVPLCIEEKEKPKLVIKAENVVTVYFDFDKSNLKPRAVYVMDSIYNVLSENNTATIQISGYTDGLGTDEYNKKLSDRRARACADYLVKKGIDTSRISFVSFGECCPVEMEIINGRDNPDGRSKNRRALINISKEE